VCVYVYVCVCVLARYPSIALEIHSVGDHLVERKLVKNVLNRVDVVLIDYNHLCTQYAKWAELPLQK